MSYPVYENEFYTSSTNSTGLKIESYAYNDPYFSNTPTANCYTFEGSQSYGNNNSPFNNNQLSYQYADYTKNYNCSNSYYMSTNYASNQSNTQYNYNSSPQQYSNGTTEASQNFNNNYNYQQYSSDTNLISYIKENSETHNSTFQCNAISNEPQTFMSGDNMRINSNEYDCSTANWLNSSAYYTEANTSESNLLSDSLDFLSSPSNSLFSLSNNSSPELKTTEVKREKLNNNISACMKSPSNAITTINNELANNTTNMTMNIKIESDAICENNINNQINGQVNSISYNELFGNPICARQIDPNKPTESYLEMIAKAILSSHQNKMQLKDIYEYICKNYEYYANHTNPKKWKNSIRHNLSRHACFIKSGKDAHGHYWSIHASCLKLFKLGIYNGKALNDAFKHKNSILRKKDNLSVRGFMAASCDFIFSNDISQNISVDSSYISQNESDNSLNEILMRASQMSNDQNEQSLRVIGKISSLDESISRKSKRYQPY